MISQFPDIEEYMVTFSVGEAPERAAAKSLFSGAFPGRSPVGLPGVFARSDGVAGSSGK